MQSPQENPSPLARIRAATQADHQRAESLVGLPTSLDHHIQTLKNFLGFIQPWEIKLQSILPNDILHQRQKTPLLIQDLQSLGTANLNAIPRCTILPNFHDIPTALGSMYVFEGATLGGQILSKHIEQTLGRSNGNGYSFYQSYGPKVGPMWRSFGSLLTTQTPPSQSADVIASAQETFRMLCEWLESRPPNRQHHPIVGLG